MGERTGMPAGPGPDNADSPAATRNIEHEDRIAEADGTGEAAEPESTETETHSPLLLFGLGAVAVVLSVAIVATWMARRSPNSGGSEAAASGTNEVPGGSEKLVLDWPSADRRDAILLINGRVQPLEALQRGMDNGRLEIALASGVHEVWIGRPGFLPYEAEASILAGTPQTLTPEWLPRGQARSEFVDAASPATVAASPPDRPEPDATASLPKLPELPHLSGPSPGMDPAPVEPLPDAEQNPSDEVTSASSEAPAVTVADPPAAWRQLAEEQVSHASLEASIQQQVAAWDFSGAAQALGRATARTPSESELLKRRVEALEQLAGLKDSVVAVINRAAPTLRKSDLMLRGAGGDVKSADARGIVALVGGQEELHPWSELGEKALDQLLQQCRQNCPPERLAEVALLAEELGQSKLAEEMLVAAKSQGVETGNSPAVSAIVASRVLRAVELLQAERYQEADAILKSVSDQFQDNAWLSDRQEAIASAMAQAETGLRADAAEALYQAAVQHHQDGELRLLAEAIQQLRTEFPNAELLSDAARSPSIAELEAAVADLGGKLVVRLDGQGDHTTIQAAIDAAADNTLIEIADRGPYNESLRIPSNKSGLTVQGAAGIWPLITSAGPVQNFPTLLSVEADGTTIERLILVHAAPGGDPKRCLSVTGKLRMRSCFAQMPIQAGTEGIRGLEQGIYLGPGNRAACAIEDSILYANTTVQASQLTMTNCVVLGEELRLLATGCEFTNVTATARIVLLGGSNVFQKSILNVIGSSRPGNRIESCNVAAYLDKATPGAGCTTHVVQFRAPMEFDFRQLGDRRRPAAGGDWGCDYTPEMVELTRALAEHGIRPNLSR